MKCSISSRAALRRAAARIAQSLHGGMCIGLGGPLGAGKTTLVGEIARALHSTDPVSSPSFALCHEYITPRGVRIEHWDLYRLTHSAPLELLEPTDSNTVRFIEWAERVPELPLSHRIAITPKPSPRTSRILRSLETDLPCEG